MGHLHKGLEGHCYHIAGEDSGRHCMGHFEERHIEQDYFAEERHRGLGLEVHYRKKRLVAVGIEAVLEAVLAESCWVDHTAQKAGHIVEDLAGNLLVDHIVEDMAGEHYKEVHCRRKEFGVVHRVGECPVDSHSVGHKAH